MGEMVPPSMAGGRAGVDRLAKDFLLRDGRFQQPPVDVKRRIFSLLGLGPSRLFSPQSFDLLMTEEPVAPVTVDSVASIVHAALLVEVKGTNSTRVRDSGLANFFFGATATQFALAAALGDQFRYAFVVLHASNTYGQPFAVLLTAAQVQARIATARLQYQINFHANVTEDVIRATPPIFVADREPAAPEERA